MVICVKEKIVLCAASSYEQKYYINPLFSDLPESIQKELQIMCVLYTEEIRGILSLEFEGDGTLIFQVSARENDFLFDEIGSVLKLKHYQEEKKELLSQLELYYKVYILKSVSIDNIEEKTL